MKRILIALLVSITVGLTASDAAQQRSTGDQSVRLARRVFVESIEGMMVVRRSQCLRAFGHAAFCDCINGDLPAAVDLRTYIAIAVGSRETDSTTSTGQDQRIVDVVRAVRDRCIASVFRPLP